MHALKEKDDGRFIKVANIVGYTMCPIGVRKIAVLRSKQLLPTAMGSRLICN